MGGGGAQGVGAGGLGVGGGVGGAHFNLARLVRFVHKHESTLSWTAPQRKKDCM